MCETHEPTANYLAWLAIALVLGMFLYGIFRLTQRSPVERPCKSTAVMKGKAMPIHKPAYGLKDSPLVWQKKMNAVLQANEDVVDDRAILPPIIYVSSKLVGSDRSYHTCQTCPALNRVSSVCSAVVCKTCVKLHTSRHTD